MRIQEPGPETQNPGPRIQDPGPKTSRSRTQDIELGIPGPIPIT